MSILFLHGLESGPGGRKARYLQGKYPSKTRVPDLQMSLWRLDRANSIFRNALRLACRRPSLLLTNWNGLLKAAALESLAKCADVAVQEIRNSVDRPPQLVVGSSWGGAVALLLLARGDWKGPTLLLAPALKKLLLMDGSNDDDTTRQQIKSWYEAIKSNRTDVAQRSKIVVVHGDRDDTVSLEDSKELCEATGAELIIVPGGDHSLNDYLLHQNKFPELIDPLLRM